MTFLPLCQVWLKVYKPRLTDFRGGKNAKPLYELSRRRNDLQRAPPG